MIRWLQVGYVLLFLFSAQETAKRRRRVAHPRRGPRRTASPLGCARAHAHAQGPQAHAHARTRTRAHARTRTRAHAHTRARAHACSHLLACLLAMSLLCFTCHARVPYLCQCAMDSCCTSFVPSFLTPSPLHCLVFAAPVRVFNPPPNFRRRRNANAMLIDPGTTWAWPSVASSCAPTRCLARLAGLDELQHLTLSELLKNAQPAQSVLLPRQILARASVGCLLHPTYPKPAAEGVAGRF